MTNTLKKTLSGKNVVVANAEVFIVPNHACLASDYFSEDHKEKVITSITNLCQINGGKSYDPTKDRLIQLWYVAEDDLDTDNLGDHGFRVTDSDGTRYGCHINRCFGSLPASVLPTKEGETVTLTLPGCKGTNRDDDTEIEFDLVLNLTANQTSYRYRRFGNFEEVIKAVC